MGKLDRSTPANCALLKTLTLLTPLARPPLPNSPLDFFSSDDDPPIPDPLPEEIATCASPCNKIKMKLKEKSER